MARKSISPEVISNVLLKSRRRCCICYGLDRDTTLRSGQVAHLDQNASNNSEDNLAFLCLHHHDEYDSRTSQRKGFSVSEVKEFRAELYKALGQAFTQPVHFGKMRTPPEDPYAGQYIRMNTGPYSSEISLTPLPDSIEGQRRYFVSGFALWGTERPGGPNMGILEFVGEINDRHQMRYERELRGENAISLLQFGANGSLIIEETNCFGDYGANVSFEGEYQRA